MQREQGNLFPSSVGLGASLYLWFTCWRTALREELYEMVWSSQQHLQAATLSPSLLPLLLLPPPPLLPAPPPLPHLPVLWIKF